MILLAAHIKFITTNAVFFGETRVVVYLGVVANDAIVGREPQ